jgi:hypothetical protein
MGKMTFTKSKKLVFSTPESPTEAKKDEFEYLYKWG